MMMMHILTCLWVTMPAFIEDEDSGFKGTWLEEIYEKNLNN